MECTLEEATKIAILTYFYTDLETAHDFGKESVLEGGFIAAGVPNTLEVHICQGKKAVIPIQNAPVKIAMHASPVYRIDTK